MTPFPIDLVRARFPAIAGTDRPPVYLDNAAGTQVPQPVIDAVARAMADGACNLGGKFAGSHRAMEIWDAAHVAGADIVGAPSPRGVIIGASMTALTLHMSRSIALLCQPGDEIVLTRMDHEGDVAPWLLMARDRGLTVRWVPFDTESWQIEPDALRAVMGPRTRLVAMNYASNMTGSINDIAALVRVVHEFGALAYVDAVQLTPHHLPDVQALDCDFLVCSAYKFFGPHMAVLWGRERVLEMLEAYKCRCSSDDLPEKFEHGTPQTELLAGLTATADYLAWLGDVTGHAGTRRQRMLGGYAAFGAHETPLTLRLIAGILAIPGTTIHGITNPNRISQRVPTVSFTHDRISTHTFAQALADQNIFVWSGHNYALEPARQLGLDEDTGVVRLAIAHYNTAEEIERVLVALAEVAG
ncbi:cysteine desulfurase-like protein [Novosphingobium sp.]|uniref:cysteine desulfurase-like protein n=1 Tax=Novosphingobium sp. TaxID=1874826 RepID=UPI00333EEBC4